MATAEAVEQQQVRRERTRGRFLRFLGRSPVHILLVVLGLLWLVPTIGLFLTSLLSAEDYLEGGWWQVISEPSKFTFENYSAIFDNETITSSLVTTIWIAIGGTLLPILVGALAGYAFAWLEFPGRDWLFVVVIALLVVPLQMALIPMFRLYETFGINDDQQRRRLDGAAAHDDVGRVDRDRTPVVVGDEGARRPPAVEHEAVDAVAGRARGRRPRRRAAGTSRSCCGGARNGRRGPRSYVIQRGISSWRQSSAAAPRRMRLARRGVGAGHGLHRQLPLDLVADGVELVGAEAGDVVRRAPAVQHVLGRAAVQAAVDLRPAADAAALGVGDRREADRRGHAAGPVLAVHLLERERHDLALADVGALLQHEHVEAGLGQHGRGRRPAGAGADDEDLGDVVPERGRRPRSIGARPASGRPVADVSGQRLPDVGVRQRAHQPHVLAGDGERAAGQHAHDAPGADDPRRAPPTTTATTPTATFIGDGRPAMRRVAKATVASRRSGGSSGRSWATTCSQNSATRPRGGNVGIGTPDDSGAPGDGRGTAERCRPSPACGATVSPCVERRVPERPRLAGDDASIPELAGDLVRRGVRRIHVLAWRDLDDPDAGGSELHADEFMRRWADAGLDDRAPHVGGARAAADRAAPRLPASCGGGAGTPCSRAPRSAS